MSKQQESGVKWDRGTYGLTAAYFDIRKPFATPSSRALTAAPRMANGVWELPTSLRTWGAEADITTAPGPTLKRRVVHAGAAYLDLKNTQQVRERPAIPS